MEKRTVVFAGSFDPVTLGHVDIVRRARDVFGAVRVLLIANSNKRPIFTEEERLSLLKETFKDEPHVQVECAEGLLTDYLKKNNLRVVVRGLRGMGDVEHEMTNAHYNKLFYPEMETLWFSPRPEYSFLSSSAVREAAGYGGDVSSLVPACVARALKEK